MTVNAMKLALGLASLGSVHLSERVSTGPPRVPENPRMLFVSNKRHFPLQFDSSTLFFGTTALQRELSVGTRWKNLHARNGEPPLFTLGEGGSCAHRLRIVFSRVSGGRS
jgi:hypothetical protein